MQHLTCGTIPASLVSSALLVLDLNEALIGNTNFLLVVGLIDRDCLSAAQVYTKAPPKHTAELSDYPCRPGIPQRVGVRFRSRVEVCLGRVERLKLTAEVQ